MQNRTEQGGRTPADTKVYRSPIIEEQPSGPDDKGYVVSTPVRGFNGVIAKYQFVRGKTTVYKDETARMFLIDYGYAVDPMPDIPTPKAPRREGALASSLNLGKHEGKKLPAS